ncbi:hypothetical protein EJ06DRAFT_559650 [Trichodelitschia bisporula]|uniref:Uncharacterized protein n=1 Tax=Trichodelitschia bisporula TaxID=703511 RepID=A0A6G1HKJ3_9PEZI|nr:hypothetical protein EJ06DRAFT_559650 [Trichodelitschia bisporula]
MAIPPPLVIPQYLCAWLYALQHERRLPRGYSAFLVYHGDRPFLWEISDLEEQWDFSFADHWTGLNNLEGWVCYMAANWDMDNHTTNRLERAVRERNFYFSVLPYWDPLLQGLPRFSFSRGAESFGGLGTGEVSLSLHGSSPLRDEVRPEDVIDG